jgi:hypothetical protein
LHPPNLSRGTALTLPVLDVIPPDEALKCIETDYGVMIVDYYTEDVTSHERVTNVNRENVERA